MTSEFDTETFSIQDLTPPIIERLMSGACMINSVVLGVSFTTADGAHQDITLWDSESAVSTHLGLADLINRVMDIRADASCLVYHDEPEEELP